MPAKEDLFDDMTPVWVISCVVKSKTQRPRREKESGKKMVMIVAHVKTLLDIGEVSEKDDAIRDVDASVVSLTVLI